MGMTTQQEELIKQGCTVEVEPCEPEDCYETRESEETEWYHLHASGAPMYDFGHWTYTVHIKITYKDDSQRTEEWDSERSISLRDTKIFGYKGLHYKEDAYDCVEDVTIDLATLKVIFIFYPEGTGLPLRLPLRFGSNNINEILFNKQGNILCDGIWLSAIPGGYEKFPLRVLEWNLFS